MRSQAGSSNPIMLERARQSIEQAHKGFTTKPYCHNSYAMRAAYELALCSIAARDFRAARKWTKELKNRAEELDDPRWKANVWIVKSRIITRQKRAPAKAQAAATKAKELMVGQEESLGVIDAHIAHAEALLNARKPSDARQDLNEALRIVREHGRPNQKIEGVLHLMFARSHILDGDTDLADVHLAEWDVLENYVEHGFVREMATYVKTQLMKQKRDFTIQWTTADLTYKARDKELRAWLITHVRHGRREKTREELAGELGIKRPTLNKWEGELKDELRKLKESFDRDQESN